MIFDTDISTGVKVKISHVSRKYERHLHLGSTRVVYTSGRPTSQFAFSKPERQVIQRAFTWQSSLSDFNVLECLSQ